MAACWNVINTEWDPDQETVNFGTRQCVVVDAALFDVVTLDTVDCTNPVSNDQVFIILFSNCKFFKYFRGQSLNQESMEACGNNLQFWQLIAIVIFSPTIARLF